jgi:DNA invertase Pin-like site-specific DNA recombinase
VKAVIYIRVSTEGQARDGVGLDAQLERCRALAVARGATVVAEHRDEGLSGRDGLAQRPGLAAAVEQCRATGAVLMVYSVSRIARRQRLLWSLLDPESGHGLAVVSATEPFDTTTPMGRAMLGMIAVWSQLEADLVSQRTKDALATVKANGTRLGAPPASALVPGAVARIRALRAEGRSVAQIADTLNSENVPSARGGKWWPKTVRYALAEVRA